MPGPLLTATINESYYKGKLAAPRLIIGYALLELVLVIGLVLGLGVFLVLPSVKTSMALIGGTFLLWMGWGIMSNSKTSELNLDSRGKITNKQFPTELIGVLTSISNPYWIFWWATICLSYLTVALQKGVVGLAAFLSALILFGTLWLALGYLLLLFLSGIIVPRHLFLLFWNCFI